MFYDPETNTYKTPSEMSPGESITMGNVNQANPKHLYHDRLCNDLHDLYLAKNKDYRDSYGRSYKRYGNYAIIVRMFDKFNRLEELLLYGDQVVKDESVIDTLMDMANYSLMAIMELKNASEK